MRIGSLVSRQAWSAVLLCTSLSLGGCGDDDGNTAADASDAAADTTASPDVTDNDTHAEDTGSIDELSGVYNVTTVTCAGQEVPLMVTATVTFDGDDYLEEWTLPNSACEVTLAGSVESNSEQLTLTDVVVTCGDACADLGFCDPTHCSSDQTYQYTRTSAELLLSFTQQGDEFSCGPCGDGVASTYLLEELP